MTLDSQCTVCARSAEKWELLVGTSCVTKNRGRGRGLGEEKMIVWLSGTNQLVNFL